MNSRKNLIPLIAASLLLWVPGVPGVRAAEGGVSVQTIRVPDGGIHLQARTDDAGRMHLTYVKGDPMRADLYYVRSDDGGKTFSKPLPERPPRRKRRARSRPRLQTCHRCSTAAA